MSLRRDCVCTAAFLLTAVAGFSAEGFKATIVDGTGTSIHVSDLKARYLMEERVIGGTREFPKHPEWLLTTLHLTVWGRQGAASWSEPLAFQFADLKRISHTTLTNVSQERDLPRLEIERRNGSLVIITPTSYEERDASGHAVKQAILTGWQFESDNVSGEKASLAEFVGRATSPLGSEVDFSLNPLGVRSIVFE